jgi:CheY-like chemotaxis protein
MKCPKCSASFSGKPNEAGLLTCPTCGARLRTKTTAVFKAQSKAAPAPAEPTPKPGGKLPISPTDTIMARVESHPPLDIDATIPRGMTAPSFARPRATKSGAAVVRAKAEAPAAARGPVTLEALWAEIQALRKTQLEILALLQGGRGATPAADASGPGGVLVVDDDPDSRETVVRALADGGVTVREAPDGSEALSAIALQKPAVIVLEPDMGGPMPGRDILGMIQATMEWVDIPVILYTRAVIESEEEARTEYGADHLVHKGAGSSEALVALVHELLEKA